MRPASRPRRVGSSFTEPWNRRIKKPLHAVDGPVSVVRAERSLMSPLIPHLAQFTDQATFGVAENLPENLILLIPQGHQEGGGVPLGSILLAEQLQLAGPQGSSGFRKPLILVFALMEPLHHLVEIRRLTKEHLLHLSVINAQCFQTLIRREDAQMVLVSLGQWSARAPISIFTTRRM